ncbi:hypothetical protein [Sphingobacterium arenae]|uniref:Uncharacterized protein n=1 Tax=Sphingobacterium arenae TaxID=1280598 RepID=A0ABR7Y2X7_9SPHI|nr:hypothetical protein [Sphingobacterium arenae]MBD1425664.1 hypothetical protein [Sphingobacterium arenae]
MNIIDAKNKLKKYQRIIGKVVDNKEISEIAIHPTNDSILPEITMCLLNFVDYDYMLSRYTDFDLVVIYDIEDFPSTGYVMWDTIDNVTKKLKI